MIHNDEDINSKTDTGEVSPVGEDKPVTVATARRPKEDVKINETTVAALPPLTPEGGAVGFNGETSPILNEMNNQDYQVAEDQALFEEIPLETCGQLYATALELGFALKHKGTTPHPVPQQRIDTQGAILYGILKKNQMSIAHIDLFMFAVGMIGDWKVMDSYRGVGEAEKEGTPENKAAYGEVNNGE